MIYMILAGLLQVNVQVCLAQSAPATTGEQMDPQLLEEALMLVEIYYKVKRLSHEQDGSKLKPYLNQLNAALDRAIRFKEGFTPKKQAQLLKQLETLKTESEKLADLPPSKMKSHLPKLTDALWDLVQILIQ